MKHSETSLFKWQHHVQVTWRKKNILREEHLHLPQTPCRQGTSFCRFEISARSCSLIMLRDLGSGFRPASLASLGSHVLLTFSHFCRQTLQSDSSKDTFHVLHSQSTPFSPCTKPPVDQEIHEIFGFFPKHCMNHALDHWIQLLQDVALLFLTKNLSQLSQLSVRPSAPVDAATSTTLTTSAAKVRPLYSARASVERWGPWSSTALSKIAMTC